ncbi:MAG TPA: hypothetical protein VF576_03460, partial [Rubricoccaceae bacterium]
MADREVRVSLVADERGLVTGVRNARGELVSFERQAESTSTRAGGALGKLGGIVKGMIAAQALQALVQYTRRMFELGTAATEVQDAFTRVYGSGSQMLDSFLAGWANLAGLTRTEAREISVSLGGMGRGLDMTGEQTAAFSQRVLTLAGDIASLRNVPIREVLQSIQSGIAGETEPMRRYGVFLKDVTVEQEALRTRASGTSGELTEQEKVLARLTLITRGTASAANNLTETQEAEANSARRVAAEAREMEQEFATKLLPSFALAIDGLDGIVAGNDAAAGSFTTVLARGVLVGVNGLLNVVGAAVGMVRAFRSVGQAIFAVSGDSNSPLRMLPSPLEHAANAFRTVSIGANVVANGLYRIAGAYYQIVAAGEAYQMWKAGDDATAYRRAQENRERALEEIETLTESIITNREDIATAFEGIKGTFGDSVSEEMSDATA